MAFTREDFNSIIRQINELAANPSEGCNPLPSLPEVPPGSKWRKSDITAAQNLLKQICDENTFSDLPALWKQSIVDELNAAIERGWCGCEPDDNGCTPANVRDEDGTSFTLLSNGPAKVISPCLGNDSPPVSLASLINGMTIGRCCIFDRQWHVFRTNQSSGLKVHVTAGTIDCHGTVHYSGPVQVPTAVGIFVFCSDCHTEGCAEALATATAELTDPNNYDVYSIEIDSAHAACALPGECP